MRRRRRGDYHKTDDKSDKIGGGVFQTPMGGKKSKNVPPPPSPREYRPKFLTLSEAKTAPKRREEREVARRAYELEVVRATYKKETPYILKDLNNLLTKHFEQYGYSDAVEIPLAYRFNYGNGWHEVEMRHLNVGSAECISILLQELNAGLVNGGAEWSITKIKMRRDAESYVFTIAFDTPPSYQEAKRGKK